MAAQVQFERLYRAHAQAVYRYCLRRVPHEDAKDAVAEVFAVAWRRFDVIPNDDGQLPWLYRVANNVLHHQRRSVRRRDRLAAKVASQTPRSVEGPEPQVVRHAAYDAVIAAIGQLPATDQEIIRLVEWEGLSREQVADMMFLSRSAIDKRITRAYKKLERHLSDDFKEVRSTPVPMEEGGKP